MAKLLTVRNLTKHFSGLTAVDDVSFDLEESGVHALIGPNGSGKTTTINLITGVLPADEGSILFDGHELSGLKPHEIARLGLRRTYQNLRLFKKLTIRENIMIGAQQNVKAGLLRTILDRNAFRSEEAILRDKAQDVIRLLGLERFADHMADSEPYGIQKLTAVGVALVDHPKLLLLDEPAAGLNPSERSRFIDIIYQILDAGPKIFLVEHNMDVVMNISKKVTVLNFGSKIAEGAPDEIKQDSTVIKAYLGRKFDKHGQEDGGNAKN